MRRIHVEIAQAILGDYISHSTGCAAVSLSKARCPPICHRDRRPRSEPDLRWDLSDGLQLRRSREAGAGGVDEASARWQLLAGERRWQRSMSAVQVRVSWRWNLRSLPLRAGSCAARPENPSQRDRFLRSKTDTGPLPANEEDIGFAPLTQLSRWIKKGKLTSRRLTNLYLERLEKFDPRLRCAITFTRDLARAQATKADEEIAAGNYRGPLHGIPWGGKDLLDTAGIPTTYGAEPFRNRVPAAGTPRWSGVCTTPGLS